MGALDGITVLDLAILVQGPQAAAMLHDLGATVIKVELPGFGDLGRYIRSDPAQGASGFFEGCNRGKRSVTLDLRTAGGKRALRRLVERADVLIHNFVPGTMESWGLSYEELSAINPALVYAGGSTFGPLGPDAAREGADTLGQAAGGLMSTTGSDGEPPTAVGAVIADHIGCQNMVSGILAALLHRERRSGRGQRVEVSLLGGQIWAQCSELTHYLLHGQVPGRANRGHPIIKGLLRMVPTADGWIQLVGVPRQLWPAFAHAIDRPDLADDPRFLTLLYAPEDLAELCRLVDEVFPTRTTAEWCERLLAAGQRFAPVRDYAEVAADPGAVANGYLVEVDHPERGRCLVVGNPIRLSDTPTVAGVVAPELGQHTEEVLLEAGFSWEEIEQLRADGAW
ncbi:MAG: CaiB/BaiF CoA transferase family protein [Acidimicrobiia bacterium]